MACPRCGQNRVLYEMTFSKRFPNGQTMERKWLLCQSCIADIIDFIGKKEN